MAPRMVVLTWVRDWESAERRLIAAHRKAGADLLNVARGGVDIPADKTPVGDSLKTLHWRKIINWFMIGISVVDEPIKSEFRAMLRATAKLRRAILLRFGRAPLEAYDLHLHAQIVLNAPMAYRPLPDWIN